MLRTIAFALALGASGLAAAEQFPDSALHAEIRSDTGQVIGRVEAVERDGEGRIVAIEAEALAPADAPSGAVVAQQREVPRILVRENARQNLGTAAAVRSR